MKKRELKQEIKKLKAEKLVLEDTIIDLKARILDLRGKTGDFSAIDHNVILDIAYQTVVFKQELNGMAKAIMQKERIIDSQLNGFKHRYPRLKKYAEDLERKSKENDLKLSINYNGIKV